MLLCAVNSVVQEVNQHTCIRALLLRTYRLQASNNNQCQHVQVELLPTLVKYCTGVRR